MPCSSSDRRLGPLAKVGQGLVDLLAQLRREEQPMAGIDVGKRLFAGELKLLAQPPAIFGQIVGQFQPRGLPSTRAKRTVAARCVVSMW